MEATASVMMRPQESGCVLSRARGDQEVTGSLGPCGLLGHTWPSNPPGSLLRAARSPGNARVDGSELQADRGEGAHCAVPGAH